MASISDITIQPADASHLQSILSLLPELADFDVPPRRNPDHLWQGDAEVARQYLADTRADDSADNNRFIDVAVNQANGQVLGVVIVTMRPELLSQAPSAHLEGIVVHADARGTGLGRRLLRHVETEVKRRGAESLTLHVFANNRRAHSLYTAEGFDSELIRAVKWLS